MGDETDNAGSRLPSGDRAGADVSTIGTIAPSIQWRYAHLHRRIDVGPACALDGAEEAFLLASRDGLCDQARDAVIVAVREALDTRK
jgi:hypothetical protein